MNLSQVLQLVQNKTHPSQRGGVPISMNTFARPGTQVEDVNADFVDVNMGAPQVDIQREEIVAPPAPMLRRQAPTLNNSGSQELMRQAQAILAGLGNDPRPQIKSPNNESILLSLLPALMGAGTNYLGQLGQGYMAGQNQELALIEQERRRREQNIMRQAQAIQDQAQDVASRENLLFSQDNQNFRNEADNARMLTNTEIVQNELNKRFGMGDQTKRDIFEGQQQTKANQLDLDKEKFEAGFVAKMWALELKDANMDGNVTEDDIARLKQEATRIGGAKYAERLPMPPIGSSWAKIKQDSDMAYKQLVLDERKRNNQVRETVSGQRAATSQQNADTSKARLEGKIGGGSGGSKPNAMPGDVTSVSPKEASRLATKAQISINRLRKMQKLEGDQAKKARYEIEIQGLASTRDDYRAIAGGGALPLNPGAPQTNAGKAAAEKARTLGAGIPFSESYAQGGSGRQRTQSEIDAAVKKPTANQIKVGGQNLNYNLNPKKK